MKYFGKPINQGGRLGFGILSTIKGALILKDVNEYVAASQNPIYWPAIAIDFIVTADLILTAYSGKVFPITTTIIGKLPYGERLLKKVEGLYDFLLYGNEMGSLKEFKS